MSERYGMKETAPGSGRWRIWVYVDVVDGKQRQVTKQFHAKGIQAARRQATIEANKLTGKKAELISAKGTVGDLVVKWQRAHDTKGAASSEYRRRPIIKGILDEFGKVRLEDLTPMHIEAWYEKLRAETKHGKLVRTESTVHHWHRQLGAIINQGEKWDMIDRNPMRRVTPPKRKRKRAPQPPTVQRLGTMREQASPGLALAIRLAVATGLRRGELMGLRLSDIQGNLLTVERAVFDVPGMARPEFKALKHDKPRQITIDPGTLQAIRDYHARTENAGWHGDVMILPDFADPTGCSPRRPGWLTKAWGRLCVANDVHIRWHDIRHAHATMLHALGIPMAVVSERIGHSLLSTTMDIYTSAEQTGDALASAAIGRALDG